MLFTNEILRDLDNTKILLYKLLFGTWLSNLRNVIAALDTPAGA